MLAINICQSKIATKIGLPKRLSNLYNRSFFFDPSVDTEVEGEKLCPLRHWNSGVRRLTYKCMGKDISPCYKALIHLVDLAEFEDHLAKDQSLFLPA